MGDFRMMDVSSALRSQNERENILTRFRLMTDYSTFLKLKLKLKLKRNPDRETLYYPTSTMV